MDPWLWAVAVPGAIIVYHNSPLPVPDRRPFNCPLCLSVWAGAVMVLLDASVAVTEVLTAFAGITATQLVWRITPESFFAAPAGLGDETPGSDLPGPG
jgi:hypothetical protein